MTNIFILGGYGMTGRLLARHLLEESEANIILGGRHIEKAKAYADQFNKEFNGERVSAVCADAGERGSLIASLKNVDLLLVASPTTKSAKNVVYGALDSGVDYLDIQLGAEKFALLNSLSADIEKAGRCFITEAGFHPGLPSAMVRYAAAQLDRIDSAITAGYLNMGHSMPYTEAVDELMDVFENYQSQVFKNGQWTKAGSFEIRRIDFHEAIGRKLCFPMFFEELRALPEMYPTLQEVGFYISESHWMVDWVITPIVMAALKLAPRYTKHPMGKFLWWGMQTFPAPPYIVLLKVEANGEKHDDRVQFEAGVSHSDGYELTAIPVVACILQYLDGSARRPGLWMMGHLVEPVRLFRDMERMGVNIITQIHRTA